MVTDHETICCLHQLIVQLSDYTSFASFNAEKNVRTGLRRHEQGNPGGNEGGNEGVGYGSDHLIADSCCDLVKALTLFACVRAYLSILHPSQSVLPPRKAGIQIDHVP